MARDTLRENLLELLFPTRCCFCRRVCGKGLPLCKHCSAQYPDLSPAAQRQSLTRSLTCWSPLRYGGAVREALLRYKFHSLVAYAPVFGKFMRKCLDENEISCDSITWVPLSRRRLRKRGYDQARLLAEALAVRLSLPCERTLVKKRNNPPQSRTGRASARKANVAGAYEAAKGVSLRGKSILLIDDIVTTGSTLSECAGVLRRAGAASVSAATVARGK